jgi:hypothetical protein
MLQEENWNLDPEPWIIGDDATSRHDACEFPGNHGCHLRAA